MLVRVLTCSLFGSSQSQHTEVGVGGKGRKEITLVNDGE